MAAEPGWYAGVGIGYADVVSDDDEDDIKDFLNSNGRTASVDNDTKNFNFRVSGGYWFTENFGAEVSYITLGEVDVDATITAPSEGKLSTNSDISGVELILQYAWPISERTDIIVKGGAIVWDADLDINYSGSAEGIGSINPSDDGTDATIGIGFARELKNDSWMWRGGYQYVDVDRVQHLFSSGLVYRFGR